MNNAVSMDQAPWPDEVRSGWLPDELNFDKLNHTLGDAELTAIDELVAKIKQGGIAFEDITADMFRHPVLDRFFKPLEKELKNGPGLVFISNLPVDGSNIDDARIIFWGIGTYFGDAVSQSVRGDKMGDVKARPEKTVRAYTSSGSLRLHTDRIDILTLMSLQLPKKGGESVFGSALKVYEIIKAERPDFLKILERGFRTYRMGEEQPGEEPITPHRVPIFAREGNLMSCYLGGNCTLHYQREIVKDELEENEVAALEYLADVLAREEIKFKILLEPGQAVFMNNYEIIHGREPFENGDSPDQHRHLLRMWLQGRPWRPRHKDMWVNKNPSGLQGVDPQPDKVNANGEIISKSDKEKAAMGAVNR